MKTMKYIALVALVMTLGLGVVSCGGYSNGKAREMIKKADKDKLKKEDYAEMIEWYEKSNEEYYDGWEKVIKDNKNYIDYTLENVEFGASMLDKYPFIGQITNILDNADEEEMGSSNYKKYRKLRDKFNERHEKLSKKVPKKKSEKKSHLESYVVDTVEAVVPEATYEEYSDDMMDDDYEF